LKQTTSNIIQGSSMVSGKRDSFGHLFREIRQSTGYSIKSLAPKLNVNYSYLSKIENNHTLPSEEFIKRASKLFGYDKEELLLKAGKLPDDVVKILRDNPKEAIKFLRKNFGT